MKKLIVLTINLITPYFLYLLAVNIKNSYGYVLWIPILGALILLNIYAFISHTKQYPLNDYKEYEFKSFVDLVDEMVNLIVAQRAYEINSKIFEKYKNLNNFLCKILGEKEYFSIKLA